MRSFVLWYVPREKKEEKVNLDIHINLWKKNHPLETFVFDFGLMVDKIDKIKEIYMYLPFEESKWSDLGHLISSNSNLIEGIFNENCFISTFHPKRLKVKFSKEESIANEEFIIYSLSPEDISKEKYSNGELLKIKTENILSNDEISENKNIDEIKRYYFRFRIEVKKDKIYLIKELDSNRNLFLDIFSRTETIDFRINDIRSCTEKINEEFCRNKKFIIKKIHYLLLRNSNDEFLYYDGESSSRILEKELWAKYIDEIPEDIISYHIKEIAKSQEKGIKTFSKLVRFRYEKTSWFRVILILLIGTYLDKIIKCCLTFFKAMIKLN